MLSKSPEGRQGLHPSIFHRDSNDSEAVKRRPGIEKRVI
jgi:hypothetical protein